MSSPAAVEKAAETAEDCLGLDRRHFFRRGARQAGSGHLGIGSRRSALGCVSPWGCTLRRKFFF